MLHEVEVNILLCFSPPYPVLMVFNLRQATMSSLGDELTVATGFTCVQLISFTVLKAKMGGQISYLIQYRPLCKIQTENM